MAGDGQRRERGREGEAAGQGSRIGIGSGLDGSSRHGATRRWPQHQRPRPPRGAAGTARACRHQKKHRWPLSESCTTTQKNAKRGAGGSVVRSSDWWFRENGVDSRGTAPSDATRKQVEEDPPDWLSARARTLLAARDGPADVRRSTTTSPTSVASRLPACDEPLFGSWSAPPPSGSKLSDGFERSDWAACCPAKPAVPVLLRAVETATPPVRPDTTPHPPARPRCRGAPGGPASGSPGTRAAKGGRASARTPGRAPVRAGLRAPPRAAVQPRDRGRVGPGQRGQAGRGRCGGARRPGGWSNRRTPIFVAGAYTPGPTVGKGPRRTGAPLGPAPA